MTTLTNKSALKTLEKDKNTLFNRPFNSLITDKLFFDNYDHG